MDHNGTDHNDTAIIVTAYRRPYYLRQTLESWRAARGVDTVRSFTVALGYDRERHAELVQVIDEARANGLPVRVKPDSTAAARARGMGRAIGEAADFALADPGVRFVIFGEEDIVVSDDVLEYLAWARANATADVLAVCAHSTGGQGWDEGRPAADADQAAVRLLPYFNPWVWAITDRTWRETLRPAWDWECDSGGAMDSGYDWHIATRIVPGGRPGGRPGGWYCAVPDASRSQNIGRDEGWAADPADFAATQAPSFRAHRDPGGYHLV